MKRILSGLSLASLALVGAAGTLQAQQPMGPPKVLQIIREEVKVGKAPVHEKSEAAFVNAFRKAKWPTHYLAASTTSGPSEAWFFVGYESFEAWEKDNQATEKNTTLQADLDKAGEIDAAYLNNSRSIVAVYREDMSYRPGVNIGEYRYFEIDTVRVRLGRGEEFAALGKVEIQSHERLNIDEHWAAYEVVEGAQAGTYLFFTPMKSLKQLDSTHDKQIREAMGEENWKRFEQFARDGIITDESNIFAFSPKMSYPTDQTIATDPSFWKPKAGSAGKPTEGEQGGGTTTPPAKKAPTKQPPKQ